MGKTIARIKAIFRAASYKLVIKLAFLFMLIIAVFGYIPPGILPVLNPPTPPTGVQTTGVDLWCDAFTNTLSGWKKVGTTPYLSSIGPGDPPTNYVNSSVAYETVGYFTFTNLTYKATAIVNVTLSLYFKTTFFMGYVEVFLHNGTTGYDLGGWQMPDAYGWYDLLITEFCPTAVVINNTKVYFDSGSYGGAGTGTGIDGVKLIVYYTYAAPQAQNVSASTTLTGWNCTFSSNWTGNSLDKGIFGWNATGSWANDTVIDPWSGTPNQGWFNVTKTLPMTLAMKITYGFFVNDTDSWAGSGNYSITLTDYGVWTRMNFTSCNYTTTGPNTWQDVYTGGMYVGSGWTENTMTWGSMTRWIRLDIMQTQDANYSLAVYEVQFYDAKISNYKSGVTVYAACGNDTGHLSPAALDNNTAIWWSHTLAALASHTLIVDCGSVINLTKVRFNLNSSDPRSQINLINIYTTGSWFTVGTSPWLNTTNYPTAYVVTNASRAVIGDFRLQSVSNVQYLWIQEAYFTYNLTKVLSTTNITFQYYNPDLDWYPHAWTSDSLNSTATGWQQGNLSLSVIPMGVHLANFSMRIFNTGTANVSIDYVSLLCKTWTLIDRLKFYAGLNSVNWSENQYYGSIVGQTSKTDLANYIDSLAASSQWWEVLKWSARCAKLGIERETAIRNALLYEDTILTYLPSRDGGPVFSVYWRDLLWSCLYYSAKYSYLTDKWNITAAYNTFRNECQTHKVDYDGDPAVLDISNDSSVFSAKRFYDENAETIGTYLVFYNLNVTSALDDAIEVWTWVNNHHWNETWQYFRYAPDSVDPMFECEATFFLKIIAMLKYYSPNAGNISRLNIDLYNRFLKLNWMSYQWCCGWDVSAWVPTNTKFALVHAYDGNTESRLQNDLGAWFTLFGIYPFLNTTGKSNMRTMLDVAWQVLYNSRAGLFNTSTQLFKTSSNPGTATSQGTIQADVRQFLLGMTSMTATLAFPLEEYCYEYGYDLDPDLFCLNLTNRTVKLSILSPGIVRFIYGGIPVNSTFGSTGVYTVTFNSTWTGISSSGRDSDLPSGRLYLLPNPSLIGTNSSQALSVCEFSTRWQSWYNLSVAEFYWNASGSMQSNGTVSLSGNIAWSNFTRTLPASNLTSYTITWYIQTNDTEAYWGNTSAQYLTVSSVTPLSVGWTNFTSWSIDVGKTLSQVNVSLNSESINWTFMVFEYANTTRYSLVKGWGGDEETIVTADGRFYVYCTDADTWAHTYP